ncbi:hypothetical protein [Streptomyces sp. NPDC049040]|uniref:hypothetical protein n=1 Tax=Streptomyces sp. NPDC049040 TaxID=3365593 RepID=UPI003716AC39
MRYAGSPSWLMRIQSPQGLLIGLFVRDAAGLHPPTAVDLPPLEPAVEMRAGLVPLAVPEASEQWARWWESELERPEGQQRGFSRPSARYGDGPELNALVQACFDDAVRWSSERGREDSAAADEALARADPGPEGDLVARVEAELGRKARPFELDVTVVPVAGAAGWRAAGTHVVVSRALRADRAAYREWLTPVVRELA